MLGCIYLFKRCDLFFGVVNKHFEQFFVFLCVIIYYFLNARTVAFLTGGRYLLLELELELFIASLSRNVTFGRTCVF